MRRPQWPHGYYFAICPFSSGGKIIQKKNSYTDYDPCPRPMAWARVKKKKPYAYYDPCHGLWPGHARVIKDLHLYVQVIIVTSNAVVISSCFQRTEQTCSEVSVARAARLFVLTQSIKYLVCASSLSFLLSKLWVTFIICFSIFFFFFCSMLKAPTC